jgi:2,3,4,5-tetrahydropyridine-2-carboxylate N-succinyltransferase
MQSLEAQITELWHMRDELSPGDTDAREVVLEAVSLLDTGQCRVAEIDPDTDEVVVHEWLKLAILLLFRLSDMATVECGPFEYHDKIPLKTGYAEAGVRVVAGASARFGAFLEPGVILMPSYVNIGARVGSGTMVDTWATVASCAQVGSNVHLAGGVGLGGVLEPPNAKPVVIEELHDRQPLHDHARCPRRSRKRPGRGNRPQPRHPRHRQRNRSTGR